MADKYCFMNAERPCDLTCKAAFEVDDPVDNIDCSFVWLAFHFGEGVLEMRRTFEGGAEAGGPGPGPGPSFGPQSKGPKGVSDN